MTCTFMDGKSATMGLSRQRPVIQLLCSKARAILGPCPSRCQKCSKCISDRWRESPVAIGAQLVKAGGVFSVNGVISCIRHSFKSWVSRVRPTIIWLISCGEAPKRNSAALGSAGFQGGRNRRPPKAVLGMEPLTRRYKWSLQFAVSICHAEHSSRMSASGHERHFRPFHCMSGYPLRAAEQRTSV